MPAKGILGKPWLHQAEGTGVLPPETPWNEYSAGLL